MSKLPQGSARNKIEFLFEKLNELVAWVEEQLANVGGASVIPVRNLFTNGGMGTSFFWKPEGKNYGTFATAMLTNPNHRIAANGWTIKGEGASNSLRAYFYDGYGKNRFIVSGGATDKKCSLRRLFTVTDDMDTHDLLFRMIFYTTANTTITVRTGNLFNEGGGIGVPRNLKEISVSAADLRETDDGLNVLTQRMFSRLDAGKLAFIEIEFTNPDRVSANIFEIGLFDINDIPNGDSTQEFLDLVFGNNREAVKTLEQPLNDHLFATKAFFNAGDWSHKVSRDDEIALAGNMPFVTPAGAANHIMIESLEVRYSEPSFPGEGNVIATCTGGAEIKRTRNGALVVDLDKATWHVEDGNGVVANPPPMVFAEFTGRDHVTANLVYSEAPLHITNKVMA